MSTQFLGLCLVNTTPYILVSFTTRTLHSADLTLFFVVQLVARDAKTVQWGFLNLGFPPQVRLLPGCGSGDR